MHLSMFSTREESAGRIGEFDILFFGISNSPPKGQDNMTITQGWGHKMSMFWKSPMSNFPVTGTQWMSKSLLWDSILWSTAPVALHPPPWKTLIGALVECKSGGGGSRILLKVIQLSLKYTLLIAGHTNLMVLNYIQ